MEPHSPLVTALPAGIRGAIVAFDGVLADTLPLRSAALRRALAGLALFDGAELEAFDAFDAFDAFEDVAGETFAESIRHRWPQTRAVDETVVDLAAMAAERAYAAAVANGVTFAPSAVLFVRESAAAGTRLVLRADSSRAIVERALRASALDDAFSMIRCADDSGAPGSGTALERSWGAIDRRLQSLGVAPPARLAIERGASANVARRYCAAVETPPPLIFRG